MFRATAPYQSRPIRKVARYLHSGAEGYPGVGSVGSSAWIKLDNDDQFSDPEDGLETLLCGWINSRGEKWGTVWRFNVKIPGFNQYDGEMRYFYVPSWESDPGSARVYRFQNLKSYDDVSFVSGSIVASATVEGSTRYEVPDADENPVFLRFGQ